MLCAVVALAGAPAALASGSDVIRDCQANDGLTRHYSASELRSALGSIPSDVNEYSDCTSIINAALHAATLKDRVKKPPSLSKPPTPKLKAQIQKQLDKAKHDASSGVHTDTAGATVTPGPGHTLSSSVQPGIPGSLLFAIVGIALLGLVELGARGRRTLQNRQSNGNREQ